MGGLAGFFQGLSGGLQFGLQLAEKAKDRKIQEAATKAKEMEANNNAVRQASEDFMRALGQYNNGRIKYMQEFKDASNVDERNMASSALAGYDKSFNDLAKYLGDNGVALAKKYNPKGLPHSHVELEEISVPSGDGSNGKVPFVVPTEIARDFRNKPDNYKISEDGRGLIAKVTHQQTSGISDPWDNKPVTSETLVQGATPTSLMFKEKQLSKSTAELYAIDFERSGEGTKIEGYRDYFRRQKGSNGYQEFEKKYLEENKNATLEQARKAWLGKDSAAGTDSGMTKTQQGNIALAKGLGGVRLAVSRFYDNKTGDLDTIGIAESMSPEEREAKVSETIDAAGRRKEYKEQLKSFNDRFQASQQIEDLVKKGLDPDITRNALEAIVAYGKRYLDGKVDVKEMAQYMFGAEVGVLQLNLADALMKGTKSDQDIKMISTILGQGDSTQKEFMLSKLKGARSSIISGAIKTGESLVRDGFISRVLDDTNVLKRKYDDAQEDISPIPSFEEAAKIRSDKIKKGKTTKGQLTTDEYDSLVKEQRKKTRRYGTVKENSKPNITPEKTEPLTVVRTGKRKDGTQVVKLSDGRTMTLEEYNKIK